MRHEHRGFSRCPSAYEAPPARRDSVRKGFTIIELLVVTILVGLMIVFLRPLVREIRSEARIYACAENLRQLSVGLRLYAGEHNEKFPANLKELLDGGYINSERIFDCPATSHVGCPENPDYHYAKNLDLMSASDFVLMKDKEENHRDSGRNVLYLSGDIEWIPVSVGAMAE